MLPLKKNSCGRPCLYCIPYTIIHWKTNPVWSLSRVQQGIIFKSANLPLCSPLIPANITLDERTSLCSISSLISFRSMKYKWIWNGPKVLKCIHDHTTEHRWSRAFIREGLAQSSYTVTAFAVSLTQQIKFYRTFSVGSGYSIQLKRPSISKSHALWYQRYESHQNRVK